MPIRSVAGLAVRLDPDWGNVGKPARAFIRPERFS